MQSIMYDEADYTRFMYFIYSVTPKNPYCKNKRITKKMDTTQKNK